MIRLFSALSVCALALSLSGCGSEARPEPTIKAGGKVSYEDGAPVTRVAVVFQRVGDSTCSAMGRLDDQGNFTLGTYAADDGAPPGKYQVFFTTAPPDNLASGQPPKIDPTAPPPAIVTPDRVVPPAYLSPDQTPLTFEISQTGDNQNIKLSVKRPTAR
jgi:hypothetical protein